MNRSPGFLVIKRRTGWVNDRRYVVFAPGNNFPHLAYFAVTCALRTCGACALVLSLEEEGNDKSALAKQRYRKPFIQVQGRKL